MSGEAIDCAQNYKGLRLLDRLPPKIIEIDGDGPREAAADDVGGGDEGRRPRIERVRASLGGDFTGKGDDEVVVGCIMGTLRRLATRWSARARW